MIVYVILSNYFSKGFFGTYSTLKRARSALEDFLTIDNDVASFSDIGDYCYEINTTRGETFHAEICFDTIDAEFEEN